MKILIVDDEPIALKSLKRILRRRHIDDCDFCENGREAMRLLGKKRYDIVLLDIMMPEMNGLQVLEAAAPSNPQAEFIMLTAVDDTSQAVRATKLGAYDYLVKPIDNDRLLLTIERAYERKGLKAGIGSALEGGADPGPNHYFGDFITQSPRVRELFHYAAVMARSDTPILIYGESGTGKELIARGIHGASRYAQGPFIPVNMSSIPDSLFESHFFGHAKGAFTGAQTDYIGYFEQAHGGTLFLDEVGDLPLHLQPKLLRVLEDKTFNRLGDNRSIRVDVRIISASNKNIDRECRENRFRSDLLFRLRSAFIPLPPLRDHAADIPLLAEHFIGEAVKKLGKPPMSLSPEAARELMSRPFPGNVRELSQIVTNAVIVATGSVIVPAHLDVSEEESAAFSRTACSLRENEEAHIVYVLGQAGGDRREAARVLGLSLRQLQRKLAVLRSHPKWGEAVGDM
jgi:DNA-binding NtrC family response regulator